ncbi:MAG: NAD-dependent epimerase/dehydratase family protein [Candidatus Aminicenantes bacterium]
MPRALVTGATGFIGSHLVETLVAKNWTVTCLLREKSRADFLRKFPVRILKGPTLQPYFLEKAASGQDYVFHAAGQILAASRKIYDQANRQLTQHLVQACFRKNTNLKRFVYISSVSAAGPSQLHRFSDESRTPLPTSEYGRSKLRGEAEVQKLWQAVPATIIRPPNVYGPRQKQTELLIKLITKRVVPVLKNHPHKTSLIYVKDLVNGIVQAAVSEKTKGQIYYLTDGKGYSWREIILMIKHIVLGNSLFLPIHEHSIYALAWWSDILKRTGIRKSYFGRKAWKNMVRTSWLYSPAKAQADFGFKPAYTLEEGIRETVQYYRIEAVPPGFMDS